MRAVALDSPISTMPVATTPPAGQTLEQIAQGFVDEGLSPALLTVGRMTVSGEEVPREYWHLVRPKPHAVVMLVLQPHGMQHPARLPQEAPAILDRLFHAWG